MRNVVVVQCEYCHKSIERTRNKYNNTKRRKGKFFCSAACFGHFRNRKVKLTCAQCGKRYIRKRSEQGGVNTFCSRSCRAIYNNHRRDMTAIRKSISVASRKRFFKIHGRNYYRLVVCPICGKSFKATPKSTTCSRACNITYRYGKAPATADEVLAAIIAYYKCQHVNPLCRNMPNRIQHGARRYYGSWNKAIVRAGLLPNKEWVIMRKQLCEDGHIADSNSEAVVDNWLYNHGVNHERRKRYPDSRRNCDFYLPDYDVWVEYFGLIDGHKAYNKSIQCKRRLARKYKLNLVEVYPDDLYPENNLDLILSLVIQA